MEKAKNLIVLRFKRVSTYGLGGIEAHGKRLGETPHVDPSRTGLNYFPVGHADLREIANARIVDIQKRNIALKRESLKRRRRKTQREDLDAAAKAAGDDPRALAEIIGEAWDPKNEMPWTECILSASHEWFLDEDGDQDPARVAEFDAFAVGYLQQEFGNELIYARIDADEKTRHLSAVIAPEAREKRTNRYILSHAQHHLFGQMEVITVAGDDGREEQWPRRSYELFQDRIADYAKAQGLDLKRGERRAAKERKKRMAGKEVMKVRNVSPARGRELAEVLVGEGEACRKKRQSELDTARTRIQRHESMVEAELDAKIAAVETGLDMLEAGEITYRPASEVKDEGISMTDRNAGKAKVERYRAILEPGQKWLLGIARRFFTFQQNMDTRTKEVQLEAAEQRRRARVLADEENRVAVRLRPTIRKIIDDITRGAMRSRAAHYTEDDFPGALSVDSDDPKLIEKHMAECDRMKNAEIRAAWHATADASVLCDESPRLQRAYMNGCGLLVAVAEARGLDLNSGIHEPGQARDPTKAHLHVDSVPEPIRVKWKTRIRQRVRA
ncbi:plasmid recombination protein [Sagittula sp. S175]|uniref:plasmid recombination protein n=1 Tax=Sagittula sp. S175 TaxID=3415129 RepID=UPI003C7CBC80